MIVNILTDQELRNKLAELAQQGFSQIKFCGGTSKNGEHYSGNMFYFYNQKNKTSYFLGLPSNPTFHVNGDNETTYSKPEKETPEETAKREAKEESGYIIELEDLLEISKAEKKVHGKYPNPNQFHFKKFFLVGKFSGHMHSFDGPNPKDAEIAAPLWFPAKMMKEILTPSHQKALEEGCKILMATDRDICMSIWDLYPE